MNKKKYNQKIIKEVYKKTFYYNSFNEDVVTNSGQDYVLPDNYEYVARKWYKRLWAAILYAMGRVFAFFYCGCHLHIKLENAEVLKQYGNKSLVIYGNHTQELSDVFFPIKVCGKGRVYTICSPANLGLPVIGKILPLLGALPIPNTVAGMRKFNEAVFCRLENSCITIFPESHVWPFYTKIRPFSASSFYYPAKAEVPSFAMTMTYRKPEKGGLPKMTAYIDGPFFPDKSLPLKQQQKQLCDMVYKAMCERAAESDYEYYKYEKRENNNPTDK